MSGTVRMRHPNLPEEQTITVAASAVPHHRAAGWIVDDRPDPEPAAAFEPADTADPEPKPARKRRRASEGE